MARLKCLAPSIKKWRIAPLFDQGELADPRIGLAQRHAELVRQADQPLARPLHEFGVGREGGVLLLHGGVDNHLREVGRLAAPSRTAT